jgi:hypothetical protein
MIDYPFDNDCGPTYVLRLTGETVSILSVGIALSNFAQNADILHEQLSFYNMSVSCCTQSAQFRSKISMTIDKSNSILRLIGSS